LLKVLKFGVPRVVSLQISTKIEKLKVLFEKFRRRTKLTIIVLEIKYTLYAQKLQDRNPKSFQTNFPDKIFRNTYQTNFPDGEIFDLNEISSGVQGFRK
jgi:hypothetical protein